MRISRMNDIGTHREANDVFGGYNHNFRINDNEFYEMENMSPIAYPSPAPRNKRGVIATASTGNINGVIVKDTPCYVKGDTLYVNGNAVANDTGDFALTDSPKQLISMGAYLIIMPDKMWINSVDTTEKGRIEAEYETIVGDMVTFSLCHADGTDYTGQTTSTTAPESPENNDMWIDTSVTPHVLKKYASAEQTWITVPTTYVKISATGIASSFKAGDGVTIIGIESSNEQLAYLNGKTSIIYAVSPDGTEPVDEYIVVVGIIDDTIAQAITETNKISVSRKMPLMDFVIEANNRLWGCRYGLNNENKVVNEIYASRLGDFKNWNSYMGVSTDSYKVSVGTDGRFTGAITHLGHPIFFKQDCLHKIYGDYPANYQVQTTACKGVEKGAGESLAIVGSTLFYKSPDGVCAYDGSLPSLVSSAFGGIKYSGVDDTAATVPEKLRAGARAGASNDKYYISMRSEIDGNWNLFEYDVRIGAWYREDDLRVDYFARYGSDLIAVENGGTELISLYGNGTKATQKTKWSVTTGVMGLGMLDHKYISRVLVRMSLDVGSACRFWVEYDSSGNYEQLAMMRHTSLNSFLLPLRPRRCDHFRLKIEGEGEAKIISISKSIEQGSDIG